MPRYAGRRDGYMKDRCDELGISWDELAHRAGTSIPTLRKIRKGEGNSYPRIIRNVESNLDWPLGSLAKIDRDGKRPVPVERDRILSTLASTVAPAQDYGQVLRSIRQQMGPAAFWREIGVMQGEEENTESQPVVGV